MLVKRQEREAEVLHTLQIKLGRRGMKNQNNPQIVWLKRIISLIKKLNPSTNIKNNTNMARKKL